MIQDKAVESTEGIREQVWQKRPLLKFVPDFFEHLIVGQSPIDVIRDVKDRDDLSWIINNHLLKSTSLFVRCIASLTRIPV